MKNNDNSKKIELIRQDFPILQRKINDHDLIYFDNAATTQKPHKMIEAIKYYYTNNNANIHRGLHTLSEEATEQYEQTRKTVAQFIHAFDHNNIVFVRGTTEGINLVASSLSNCHFQPNDEIILSIAEHHSNIVPWQILAKKLKLKLKFISLEENCELNLSHLQTLFSKKTKLVAINHISNVLGIINDVKKITKIAHQNNVPILIDGAQAAPHIPINVSDIDCDFYVFSAHKMYGPTGIGALYAKKEWLQKMPPYHGGGEMINVVDIQGFETAEIPHKFEAGTPNIADTIGWQTSINYLSALDKNLIKNNEYNLLTYATKQLMTIPGLKILGPSQNKIGVISFTIDNCHSHDVAALINQFGVALRVGHHCAMPLMKYLGVTSTLRISFGLYNTLNEIDLFMHYLKKVINLLNK